MHDDGLVTLGPDDIAEAMQLSVAAQWNQTAADWATMLQLGQGWGVRLPATDGTRPLAATTVVLPYGRFAWVSMVLVRPDHRRLGLATRLLQVALDELSRRGATPVLDATPAGRAVYLQHGFRDTWGFARYRRPALSAAVARPPAPPGLTCRPLRADDWPAIAALDVPVFGSERLPLLRALAQRLPQAAHVCEQAGRLRGFVLGRDGREASQIGPLLALDDAAASLLLAEALHGLDGAVYLDLCDRHRQLLPELANAGFMLQRPFMRMVHGMAGPPVAPGAPAPIVLVAGPELG